MLSSSGSSTWRSVGLLLLGASRSLGTQNYRHDHVDETIVTTTIFSPVTVPVTHYVDVTIPNYINTTIVSKCTVTKFVTEVITESTTTTLHHTTAVTDTETDTTAVTNTLHYTTEVTETETDSTSVTNTLYYTTAITETETDSTSTTDTLYFTVSSTETDLATVTNTETETTTSTVPATITTYTTQTVFSTTYDPCPKSCSISAETVNLYFWPTNRPYTYPSTYVDENLGYTFVSPSVYMMIPTAVGINTNGQRAGPSTSRWILALDLEEVSTIDGTATRQLTLSHLGTDCPKTADPTAIATMVDPACDPILAAPSQVRTWAYPCNACGRFGLFDPPYAVPPVTGLIETTTVEPVTTTMAAPPPPPVGIVEVVYVVDGEPVSTATLTSTGITGTSTSSVFLTAGDDVVSSVFPTSAPTTESPSDLPPITSSPGSPSVPGPLPSSVPLPSTTPVTASAAVLVGKLSMLSLSLMTASFYILL